MMKRREKRERRELRFELGLVLHRGGESGEHVGRCRTAGVLQTCQRHLHLCLLGLGCVIDTSHRFALDRGGTQREQISECY